ncbi:hypothetical protein Bca4012_063412 [Brassica carinata]
MEDEANKNLDDMADLSTRGYKFKISDWRNMSVKLYDANDEIGRASSLFGNGGMGQASSSYPEESVESKINRISQMVEDDFSIINTRLCLIEKDSKQIKVRVTALEKLQRATSYETPNNENETDTTEPMDGTTSKLGEANHDQTDRTFEKEDCLPDFVEHAQTDTTEPMDGTASKRGEANLDQAAGTFNNETEESRVQTLFEVGENVEIASGRKWYPGNVLKTDMLNGVEMVTVEYSTLFRDKKKRTKRLQESVSSDRIRPQPPSEKLGETKFFELMHKVEAYHNDGWCSGQVRMILNDDTYSVSFNRSTESIKFSLSDLRIPKEWVDGVWKMAKEKQQAQGVKPSQEDRAKKGKAVVGKKRRKAGPPEDGVEKMAKEMEEQQAQSVKPSQDDHEKRPFYINGREKEKDFFEYMDNTENNLKKEHIDAAFSMLNSKRIEQSTWFRNKSLPEACFVPVQFLESVGYNYESLKKPPKKGIQILKGGVGEVLRGLKTPRKICLEDVDVVYGVVHE